MPQCSSESRQPSPLQGPDHAAKERSVPGRYLPDAYYVAAATLYRIEWLLRTRRVRAGLRPVRYHLMAALRWQLLGDERLPASPKKASEQCRRLIELVWEPGKAEQAVLKLIPTLTEIIGKEEATGVPLGEMVRNRRFADAVRAAVLGPRVSA